MRGEHLPPAGAGPLTLVGLLQAVLGLRGRLPAPDPMPYSGAVRQALRNGDVLLFQGGGLVSRTIRWAGRTAYSHAGLVYLTKGGRVMVAEARGGLVGAIRLVPLFNAVKGSLAVDLYRVRGTTLAQLERVAAAAERYLGQAYGWPSILKMGLARFPLWVLQKLPLVGRLLPQATAWSDNDREPSAARMVCSEYVARCWREGGGVDLVPRLADRSTEPGDLARSAELVALGGLHADEAEADRRRPTDPFIR